MSEQAEQLYKWVRPDGRAMNGGVGYWFLPREDGRPGQWMPHLTGRLYPCEYGYHLCREQDILTWMKSPGALYEAETKYARVSDANKIVVREARLTRLVGLYDRRIELLFACECAEHVLPYFESRHPGMHQLRDYIDAVRAIVRDAPAGQSLYAANNAEAMMLYRDVQNVVNGTFEPYARAAARAVQWCIEGHGRDAASAAQNACGNWWERDTERDWQTTRLLEYLRGDKV